MAAALPVTAGQRDAAADADLVLVDLDPADAPRSTPDRAHHIVESRRG